MVKFGLNFELLSKENGDILKIDWENEVNTDEYVQKYEYGLFINPLNLPLNLQEDNRQGVVLNSGILVRKSYLFDLLEKRNKQIFHQLLDKSFCSIFANFPANWIQIDVSREISTSFSAMINNFNEKNPQNTVADIIADRLYHQLLSCLKYNENIKVNNHNPAIYIQEIINFTMSLNNRKNLKSQLLDMSYELFVKITNDSVTYIVDHNRNRSKHIDAYEYKNDSDIIKKLKKIRPAIYSNFKKRSKYLNSHEIYENISSISITESMTESNSYYKVRKNSFTNYLNRLIIEYGLNINNSIKDVSALFTILFFDDFFENDIDKRDGKLLLSQLKYLALERMTICDIESGNNQIIVKISDMQDLIKYLDKRTDKAKKDEII